MGYQPSPLYNWMISNDNRDKVSTAGIYNQPTESK